MKATLSREELRCSSCPFIAARHFKHYLAPKSSSAPDEEAVMLVSSVNKMQCAMHPNHTVSSKTWSMHEQLYGEKDRFARKAYTTHTNDLK